MLNIIKMISNSNLKPFLSNGYSLELLLILFNEQNKNNNKKCIEEIYINLLSNKPKRYTFDKFINRLIDQKIIKKYRLSDKRKIGLVLNKEYYETSKIIFNK